MLVSRRATAEQAEWFASRVPKFVLLPRRDGDGIPGLDLLLLALNADAPAAIRDVVDFLRARMIVLLRARADRQPCFGQALVANRGIPIRQQLADFRAV